MQAAGADPSRYNFSTRQNSAGPEKLPYILNQWRNFKILQGLECTEPVQQSLFYGYRALNLTPEATGLRKVS